MKRVCCLLLAALLLLAIFGCKKKEEEKTKKDQVVHVGETVQYGKQMFTFVSYEKETDGLGNDSYIICVNCKNNGNGTFRFSALKFDIYADNQIVGYASGTSMYTSYDHGITGADYLGYDIPAGREGKLWIASKDVPANASVLEFVYSPSNYGKITFIIDLH